MTTTPQWFSSGTTQAGGGGDNPVGDGRNSLHNCRSSNSSFHTASMPAFPDGFTNVSYTLSAWFKSDTNVPNGTNQCLFSCVSGTRNEIWLLNSEFIRVYRDGTLTDFNTRVIADNSGWYHIFVKADNTTPAVGKIWINGIELPESVGTTVALPNIVAAAVDYRIAADSAATPTNHWSGQLFDFHFLAGSGSDQTLTVDDFGRYNDIGVWVGQDLPDNTNHGTSGFHLDYSNEDPDTWLNDRSTSGNNFVGTNYNTAVDPDDPNTYYVYPAFMNDTPGNVRLTYDGQLFGDNHTFYDGSYRYLDNNSSSGVTLATFNPVTANSFYCEYYCISRSATIRMGVCRAFQPTTRVTPQNLQETYYMDSGGNVVADGVSQGATGVGFTAGDVVGIRFDTEDKTLTFVRNGEDLEPTLTLPADGTKFSFFAAQTSTKSRSGHLFNFGQTTFRYPDSDNDFGSLDTVSQIEPVVDNPADHFRVITGNGHGVLTWSEPDDTAIDAAVDVDNATSGPFSNLPVTPAAQRNWIHDFGSAKASVTHTHSVTQAGLTYALSEDGTNWTTVNANFTVTAGETITSTAAENGGNDVRYVRLFHPDTAWGIGLTAVTGGTSILATAQAEIANGLWWVKDRTNATTQNLLVDSVRGQVDGAWQAQTTPNLNPAVIDYADPNGEAVVWCWSAPNQFNIAAGTNESDVASTGRRNVDAGFSIVQWNGTDTAPNAVGHGLNTAPDFVIAHAYERPAPNNWNAYIRGMTVPGTAYFNSSVVAGAEAAFTADPNEHNLFVGDVLAANFANIAYCWHKVPNYSDFGIFQGTGRVDSTHVYCGFKPRFIMIKALTAATGWYVFDSMRNPYSPVNFVLFPDTDGAESSPATLWFKASGFRLKTAAGINTNGIQYLWAAFAEHPFTGSEIAPPTGF